MNITKIEWTPKTINVAWGCEKVSPGCKNCYAERISAIRAKHPNPKLAAKYDGVVDAKGWTNRVNMLREFPRLSGRGERIFVGSMTDLFQVGIPDDFLVWLWCWMEAYPQHTFQILTKRARRMGTVLREYFPVPLPNVWLGVTVCNQEEADEKIPLLLQTPAAKRFVSVEPMLGPVEIGKYLMAHHHCPPIDWIICGGETGPGARPMHPDWVRSLRDQCQAAGVRFFFKGWGEWVTENQSPEDVVLPGHSTIPQRWKGRKYEDSVYRVGKRRAGRLLDGAEYNEFPGGGES